MRGSPDRSDTWAVSQGVVSSRPIRLDAVWMGAGTYRSGRAAASAEQERRLCRS